MSVAPWPSAAIDAPQPVPPYLLRVDDQRMLPPHVPSGHAPTRLVRISDNNDFAGPITGPDWNNFGPIYPLIQHWSLNGGRMLVRALGVEADGADRPHAFYTSMHLLDGYTGAYIRPCIDDALRGLPNQWRWSNANDDEIVFIDPNFVGLQRYTPSTSSFSVVKEFSDRYDQIYGDFKGQQAVQSGDGRYWSLLMQRAARWYMVSWDRTTDTVTEIAVPDWAVEHRFSFGLSASGQYVWTATMDPWQTASSNLEPGVSIFDRASGRYLTHLGEMNGATVPVSHCGCQLDREGNDVWVHFWGAPQSSLNERDVRSWRLDGSSYGPGRAECAQGLIAGLYYLSGAAPGWVVVSDYPVPEQNVLFNRFPLRGMAWALKLDGSGTIYPLGATRIALDDHAAGANAGYNWYPWTTPDRNMSKVLFRSGMSSRWQEGAPSTFHAYLASS